MNKKKLLVIFVATLVLLFSAKFGFDYYRDNVSKINGMLEEVKTIDEMTEIIDSNEVVYLYMGRPNCPDSDEFETYFDDMIVEYDLSDKVYFFNIVDIYNENEKNNEYKKLLNESVGLEYTPTLAKYENGELVLVSQWTPESGYSKEMAEEFIKDSGLDD